MVYTMKAVLFVDLVVVIEFHLSCLDWSWNKTECWWTEWLWCHHVVVLYLCVCLSVCLSGHADWQQRVGWLGGFVEVVVHAETRAGSVFQTRSHGRHSGVEGVWGGQVGVVGLRRVLRGFWLSDFVLCQLGFVNSLQTTQWDRHRDIPSPHPKHYPPKKRNTNPAERTPTSIIWACQSIN